MSENTRNSLIVTLILLALLAIILVRFYGLELATWAIALHN